MTPDATPSPSYMSTDQLLAHWQGHRRLTRRVIEAFPEDQLFTFSVGSMRPFGGIAGELIQMAAPMVQGVATLQWEPYGTGKAPESREEILTQWDDGTELMNRYWSQIPPDRFPETITAFGQFTGPTYDLILYCVDNEVHHRGQGYVYLRALGIEPPPFWERD